MDGRICDYWSVTEREIVSVLHFHHPFPPGLDYWYKRRNVPEGRDAGFAIVYVRDGAPSSLSEAIRAVFNTFPKETKLYTADPSHSKPPRLLPIPKEYHNLAKNLETHEMELFLSPEHGYADRFVAKVCLGLGQALLGDDYGRSTDAAAYRRITREANDSKRLALWQNYNIQWSYPVSSWYVPKQSSDSIYISDHGDRLVFGLFLLGRQWEMFPISRSPALWPHLRDRSLIAFFASPTATYIDLMDYAEYDAWRKGVLSHSGLDRLDRALAAEGGSLRFDAWPIQAE